MSENERPSLGSREAAVRSIVNLISLATHTDEDKLAYWLDAYYQARADYERDDAPAPDMSVPIGLKEALNAVTSQVQKSMEIINAQFLKISGALLNADGPSRTPAPTEEAEGGRQIAAPTEQDWKRAHEDAVDALAFAMAELIPAHVPASTLTATLEDYALAATGRKLVETSPAPAEEPEAEDPTPVMRGRETIKLQERVKSESRSEAARKKKAAERSYKMKVADRLRELRAQGVKTGDIVRISGGNVTDSAVLSILDGQFRPIADYRALDAALEKCAAEIQKGVTGT